MAAAQSRSEEHDARSLMAQLDVQIDRRRSSFNFNLSILVNFIHIHSKGKASRLINGLRDLAGARALRDPVACCSDQPA